VLGVVAGLELADRLDVPLTVVAFRDEERGCAGSSWCAAAGQLPEAYLELHVEQGPVLERANEPIGVVTAVAGIARGEVVFEGRADHAGTTPMDVREDALVGAAEYVLRVARAPWPGTVATVGRMHVEPGAVNVVPSRVTLSVEARAGNRADLDRLIAEIGFEPTYLAEPAAMSGAPFEALKAAAPDAPELVSGAGHDAAILAAAGVPTGMVFVRSLNGGISHSPDELSSPEDIARGIDVLADALVRIAG
jgi:hydantoinase/carbamoylase family amidase